MNLRKVFFSFLLGALLALSLNGCREKSSVKEKAESNSGRVTNPLARQFDGGSYCVQTFTQGPPPAQPLHFSNKVNESDGSAKDFEADLSGDTLDQTIRERHPATDMDRELAKLPGATAIAFRDGFAENTHTNHYNRADKAGWAAGGNGMALGGTPWGLFIAKPVVTQVGAETVNGYETMKYTIDTSHQSQLDKTPLLMSGQLKDYNITGTAWVLKDANCVLQYNIDFEQDEKDGTVKKTHYEGAVTKNSGISPGT
jgi:hypothetical protein